MGAAALLPEKDGARGVRQGVAADAERANAASRFAPAHAG